MKKLLLVLAVGMFSVSCGPSLCDCVNEQSEGKEASEACKKMEEEMMKLEGEALEAKMKEAQACAEKAVKDAAGDEGGH
ncbi:MAG: hypothetical protein CL846_01870 [Crocinitomicaceae bacterium]|nr:hypothetical protein [Crocinitomicaceae bacterium]|tara:strand:- start:619 stop:855 length:237 start_codon:yes stop_codon:yes gene_type:complete